MKKHLLLAGYLFTISMIVSAQTTTITLQPDGTVGKDAELFSCIPCGYDVNNYGTIRDLNAIAWTNGGSTSNIRSVIQFDLTSIPAGATITNARLSLYYNSDNKEGQHVSSFLFKNTALLQRVTSNWTESTVTWNTQPTATNLNQVTLHASTSSTQNYPNINVTALVQDMINNPTHSFGFRLKMKTESHHRKLLFAASDNANPALRPKLVVTYTNPAPKVKAPDAIALKAEQTISSFTSVNIFPNPIKDVLNIDIQSNGNNSASLKIYNLSGEEIASRTMQVTEGANKFSLQTGNWTKGIYFITIRTSKEVVTRKLMVE